MYFILKIGLNEKDQPISYNIVSHSNEAESLIFLENAAKNYIKEECGKQTLDEFKIIDIHHFGQVNEPLIDTMLIYRLKSDPHTLHVYQRKSKEVPGILYGKTTVVEFRRVQIFTSVKYVDSNLTLIDDGLVSVGPAKIRIPRAMTVSPISDMINELKNNARFKKRFEQVESRC
ncbi:MAG: hypothetical protein QXW79_00240 [Thermoplasmata archaeon]